MATGMPISIPLSSASLVGRPEPASTERFTACTARRSIAADDLGVATRLAHHVRRRDDFVDETETERFGRRELLAGESRISMA